MTVPLHETLVAALSGEPPLRRLDLHALLYRLCSVQIIPLRNCLREPAWARLAAELEHQTTQILEQEGWRDDLVKKILRWISGGDFERCLVFCAALLRVLDTRHRERRLDVAGTVVNLPSVLGGGETLFLTSPETPLADLIPKPRRLRRGPGDLKSEPREILGLWWHLVALEDLPIRPRVQELDAQVSRELAGRLTLDLRFALASPFAELLYGIRSDPARFGADGTPYRFSELQPESLQAADQCLLEILDRCSEQRVDILCFPELTLDTSLQNRLATLLKTQDLPHRPALVMAGSFHVDSDGRWVNRCRIFSGHGQLLFSQDKCVPYRIPASQAEESPGLCALLGIDHRGGSEDIHLSGSLEIVDGPLGRLATPICLDYCGDQLREVLIATAVNLLLVPAMTSRMEPFQERARDLGTQSGAASFVTNSAWLLHQTGQRSARNLALAYLPAHPVPVLVRDVEDSLWMFSIRELLGLT